MNTPWGASQQKTEITKGISFYSTSSHGGLKVHKKLNDTIPDCMRNDSGWYEEDCEWCFVAIVFPEHFLASYALALETCRNWFPDAYEQFFGVTLGPDESYAVKQREFRQVS